MEKESLQILASWKQLHSGQDQLLPQKLRTCLGSAPITSALSHHLHTPYIYQFATITPFRWTHDHEAFQKLKVVLTKPPIFTYLDPNVLFILDTNASGIGAVLSQVHLVDKQERVIAYFSRALTFIERQYCVTRKEQLAMVKSIDHFHAYLYGRFLLRTDHAALQWLLNFRCPEGQIARWIAIRFYNGAQTWL